MRALSCALACSLGSLRGKEKKKRGFFGQRPRLRRRAREWRKGVRSGANGDRGGLAIARARDPEVPHPLCHQRTRLLLVEKEKRKRAKRFSGLEARLGTPEARAWEERSPTCRSARDLSFDRARRRTLSSPSSSSSSSTRSRASSFFDALQSFALRVALLASPDGNHVETESRNRDLARTKLLTHFEITSSFPNFSCRCPRWILQDGKSTCYLKTNVHFVVLAWREEDRATVIQYLYSHKVREISGNFGKRAPDLTTKLFFF